MMEQVAGWRWAVKRPSDRVDLQRIYECYISLVSIKWRIARMDTAKIFWSGRSQAVRLPKEFRFDASEVRIRRHGRSVILDPVVDDWNWLDRLIGPVDEDFELAAAEQPQDQTRPDLDIFE
jgi:antitoxin VapB